MATLQGCWDVGLAPGPQQAAGCLGVPGWADGGSGLAGQEGRAERWEPSAEQPLREGQTGDTGARVPRPQPSHWVPPDCVSGGVFLQHLSHVAQGIGAEPHHRLGEGAGSPQTPCSDGAVAGCKQEQTGVRPPHRARSASPAGGWWEGTGWVQTAGDPAPSMSPPGVGSMNELLAFKLESDSSLLARGAGTMPGSR